MQEFFSMDGLGREALEGAVPIGAFDGQDGLVVEDDELRAYRGGELVGSVDSGRLAEAREALAERRRNSLLAVVA